MNKAEIIEICRANDLHPRRSLGQNFLCNTTVAEKIAALSLNERNTSVLEIGPGLGAITAILCERFDRVTVIEIDKRLCPVLSARFNDNNSFRLFCGDFLKQDRSLLFDSDSMPDAIVSNLPYYVTTPIVLKAIADYPQAKKMVFMIEEDAAARFFAQTGSKAYGPLSVMTSIYGNKEKSMTVDSKSFYPAPKTRSMVIELRQGNFAQWVSVDLLSFVQNCFSNRRKTLINNIRAHYHEINQTYLLDIFISMSLSASVRADMIEPENFYALYSRLFPSNGTIIE